MSRFAAEVVDACRAVDAEFGECVWFIPRVQPEDLTAPDVADPKRPALSFSAVFIEKPAEPTEPNSYDVRQARRPGLVSVNLWLEISPGEIEDALARLGRTPPFGVHANDQVQRVETREIYRIAAEPMVSVNGVLKARLNRIG